MDNPFTAHPRSVGESYTEHLGHSWKFGFTLLGAGLACLMHGICPALFKTTGSRTVYALNAKLTGRKPDGAGYGDWTGAGV
ncbi:MAG: type 1 capsular polysaccharide biosynthesis protein [Caulobacter sp.]|jgi:hypothetical protein|nr:type 1 capsular polysaccharide biosynthesis protein [Caulobacter sp.]